MSDFLNKYALRSYAQVLIHSAIAIIIGVTLFFVVNSNVVVKYDDFFAVTSSLSVVSGALLAVYLALFFFFANQFISQRNQNIEKLHSMSTQLRSFMEKMSNIYPEISNKLSLFYDKTLHYFPGQPIDMNDMDQRNEEFLNWASEESKKHAKQLDASNPKTYVSYEMYLRDAYILEVQLVLVFRLLNSSYLWSRTIPTFIPLMVSWVIVLLISLVLSIIGNLEVIPENYLLSVMVVPIYLLLISLFALIKDVNAIVRMTRNLESAYESVMDEFPDVKKA